MPTQAKTVDRILDTLQSSGHATARKMFGEYALYYDGQVVALVCDDTIYMKKTEAGRRFVSEPVGVPAFPNAKNYLRVPEEKVADSGWLAAFVAQTAASLQARDRKVP